MDENKIIIYQTQDGKTSVSLLTKDGTVWMNQNQLAELFDTSKQNIGQHIASILKDNELEQNSVIKNYFTTAADGKDYNVTFYSLEMILAIGFRVRSKRGTQFRQWANQNLASYMIKGFVMDDERLKNPDGRPDYFEELLARIRDIRSSEKVFWRKVLDIYATSIDYDPKTESSVLFFQTIQNKMHWAAHGHTAAEIIYQRIDAQKTNLGLTHIKGIKPTKQETEIAKNYLNEEELDILNRMVTAYLDLAEIQALNRKPMYMATWIEKLDKFISITGNEILQHSGKISHQQAIEKANAEYEKYKELTKNDLSIAENHFIENIEKTAKKINKKK